jgi:hypothetical protein
MKFVVLATLLTFMARACTPPPDTRILDYYLTHPATEHENGNRNQVRRPRGAL